MAFFVALAPKNILSLPLSSYYYFKAKKYNNVLTAVVMGFGATTD